MAQYCRYCIHLHVNNVPYCQHKEKELSESSCKKPNRCKDYSFADCEPEYQDAFTENTKGYKPREPREPRKKQCDGQVSFREYIKSKSAPIELQMAYPIDPLPCPFCGVELKDFPMVMVVEPVRSEEYLLAQLNKGQFLGTDNWFHVHCVRCGATGARGLDRVEALTRWNERGYSSIYEKLKW